MRKMTLLKVEELHKRYSDQTTAICTTDGYIDGEGIASGQHPMHITFEDKFAPELGQRLLVIIETLPDLGPRNHSPATGDSYKNYVEKRREELEGAKPVSSGRKFR